MFPFTRTPPSKAELLKAKVTGGVQSILDHVPADKVEFLENATSRAAEAAHHAGEAVAARFHDLADHAQDFAQSARERAMEHAEAAREHLSASAGEARKTALHKKDELAEAAAQKRDELADTAAHKRDEYAALASQKREELMKVAAQKRDELAGTASHKKDELVKTAGATAATLAAAAAEKAAEVKSKVRRDAAFDTPAIPSYHVTPDGAEAIEVKESGSKWLWLLAGLAAGALLIFFMAPNSGRRSRALVKDRVRKLKDNLVDSARQASDEAADKAAEASHRAETVGRQLGEKLNGVAQTVENSDLVTKIKALPSLQDLAGIEVKVDHGVVTLSGPALDEAAASAIQAAVGALPGVKEVHTEFPQPAQA